jgi:hypothetical protein
MKFQFKIAIIFASICLNVAQFGNSNFEFYEFDPLTGTLKSLMMPQSTTRKYQNNIFLNNQNTQLNNNNNNKNVMNIRGEGVDQMSLQMNSCSKFWTVKNDFLNGAYGELMIPSSNIQQALVRIKLSVGSVLPSVRKKMLILSISIALLSHQR